MYSQKNLQKNHLQIKVLIISEIQEQKLHLHSCVHDAINFIQVKILK